VKPKTESESQLTSYSLSRRRIETLAGGVFDRVDFVVLDIKAPRAALKSELVQQLLAL
jgi:hypothetical protein